MSLYKRNDIWWMDVRINERRRRLSTGTKNKKLAESCYAKTVVEIQTGKWFPDESKKRKFEELRDRYMREHSQVYKAPKSHLRDGASFKHLSQLFGELTLAEITPARISEYKSIRRTEGAKPATLSRELEVLRHSLNLAVREWEWLDRNPFERVKIDKVNNKIERWLTSDEEVRLLQASLPWLRDIVIFALNTGMRQDEILSLKWSEIDLVRQTALLLMTKNKEKRTVPLNQTMTELLRGKSKIRSISGYVFTSQAENKIDARNLLRAFYAARTKAKLEDVRFHDLRHTFATRLVQSGVDLYVVKELLGHKTITMTMRYAHHDPESLRHGVEVLDNYGHKKDTPTPKTESHNFVQPLPHKDLEAVVHA